MSDLTEFLLARIAEDEAARRCEYEAEWDTHAEGRACCRGDRALAECEAKRRIVNLMGYVLESWSANHGGPGRSLWPDVNRRERSHAHSILECLGTIYDSHPDYRDEWRP